MSERRARRARARAALASVAVLAPLLACAGVDVELQVYPDSPHGFQGLPTKMSAAFNQRCELWIERVLKSAGL